MTGVHRPWINSPPWGLMNVAGVRGGRYRPRAIYVHLGKYIHTNTFGKIKRTFPAKVGNPQKPRQSRIHILSLYVYSEGLDCLILKRKTIRKIHPHISTASFKWVIHKSERANFVFQSKSNSLEEKITHLRVEGKEAE